LSWPQVSLEPKDAKQTPINVVKETMKSLILHVTAKSFTFTQCTHQHRPCGEPTGLVGDLQSIKPMKTRFQLFVLPVLIAGLNLIPAGRVAAQTFTILHRFDGRDGRTPWASLIVSGNTLYGTTAPGGGPWDGTVFAVNTDGTGFTTLHSFTATSTNSSGAYTNNDGTDLEAGLILSGGTLYGTAASGGSMSGNVSIASVDVTVPHN